MGWVGAWFNRVLGAWVGGASSEDKPARRRGGAPRPGRAKPRFFDNASAELRRQHDDDDASVMAVIMAFLAVEGSR